MHTIRPYPRSSMPSLTAITDRNTPSTLTAMVRFQMSYVSFEWGTGSPDPGIGYQEIDRPEVSFDRPHHGRDLHRV